MGVESKSSSGGYCLPDFVHEASKELVGNFDVKKFHAIVKVLKRELKGEVTDEKVDMIQKQIEFLESQTDKLSGSGVGAKEANIDFAKLKEKVDHKQKLLQARSNIQGMQGELEEPISIKSLESKFALLKQAPFDDFCHKLSGVYGIVCSKNRSISIVDYDFLKSSLTEFSKLEESGIFTDKELSYLKETLIKCKETIEISVINKLQMICELNKLVKDYEGKPPPPPYQFKLLFNYILHNPTDIPVDLLNIPQMLDKNNPLMKHIIDKMIPGENFSLFVMENLGLGQSNRDLRPPTFEDRMKCLKFIQEKSIVESSSKGEILISGGGPGGLMASMIALMQGHSKVTLLEARKEEDPMRQNIVILGKENDIARSPMLESNNIGLGSAFGTHVSADLKLLDFFGVLDLLKERGQISENMKGLVQVKIEDIQRALKDVTLRLGDQGQFSMHYEASIESLGVSDDKKALVQYKVGQQSETATCSPDVVHVMEGYRAKTRDLLGIDVIKESKVSRMGFSFYKINENKRTFFQLLKQVKNLCRVLGKVFNVGISYLKHRKGFSDELSVIIKIIGRFELLLSAPGMHYFYFSMKPEEEDQLKELELGLQEAKAARNNWADNTLAQLSQMPESPDIMELKNQFEKGNRTWMDDPEKCSDILKKLSSVVKETEQDVFVLAEVNPALILGTVNDLIQNIDRFLKDIQKRDYFVNMIAYKALGIDLEMSGTYEKTLAAASQVQRAEKRHVEVGQTHFIMGGDAESSTDPVSGAGMRTTFLRAAISGTVFSNGLADNPISSLFYDKFEEIEAKSMREEGLHGRQKYRSGSDRLERYLSIAMDSGDLTQKEFNSMLSIQGKLKSMRDGIPIKFKEEELSLIQDIKERMRIDLGLDFNKLPKFNLSKTESVLLRKILDNDWKPDLSRKEEYRALLEKIPFLGLENEMFKFNIQRDLLVRKGAQAALLLFLAECDQFITPK